jgi:hypothetical protein
LSSEVKKTDVVGEIASFTGLKLDVIKFVLDAYELVILDKLLESQLSDEDADFIELGSIVLDNRDYQNIILRASDELAIKIHDTVKTGRDFLSESVILQFNKDLLERYVAGDAESLYDTEPSIYTGGSDE